MKKIISFILTAFTVAILFAAARPSLDGRAVVADEGQMPKGLFARTIGYLPGDSVRVTNPANGSTVDVLILGSIDSSEGIAILLSPQAAESLSIKKDSNVQVKITKRTGSLDENVSGAAVLADEETYVDYSKNEELEEISPTEESATDTSDIVEDSATEDVLEKDIASEEIEETDTEDEMLNSEELSFEDEIDIEDEIVAESETFEAEEFEETAPVTEDAELIEEEAVSADAMDEENESETVELDNLAPQEEETELTVEEAKEVIEDNSEVVAEELPSSDEETIETVTEEIPEFEEKVQKEIISEDAPDLETAVEEAFESEKLPEEDVEAESVETEELPEVEEEKEVVETEELATEPQETPESFEDEKIEDGESFDAETYEPIILVPTEPNPPMEEPTESEEKLAEETVVEPFAEEKLERSIAPSTPVTEPSTSITKVEPPVKTLDKRIEDYVKEESTLEKGKYYLQIASLGNVENIQNLLKRYSDKYPVVLLPVSIKNTYRVLIGPLSADEYGMIRERFISYGFKDAFLRKIK